MNFTSILKRLTAAVAVAAVCTTPALAKSYTELKAAASPPAVPGT